MSTQTTESAINRGIKTVGVGKKGSKPLSPELAEEILSELKTGKVSAAARGAFFAGLVSKGLLPQEEVLEMAFEPGVLRNPQRLGKLLSADAPQQIQEICARLLNHELLDETTAYQLGEFLFSDQPGDGARGLIASLLRVRYETIDEYTGLLRAMQETIAEPFCRPVPPGNPVIQLAEPFDGVDHSYMITPLLGAYLQRTGYRAVHLVGRNSGPKFIFNLLDIVQGLQIPLAKGNHDIAAASSWGYFLNQSDMSPALDRWVTIRRQIIKRPFLATLERFLNPAGARILAASAFHPPYGEKMLGVGEKAGIPGMIIIRNGIEGTMAFPLKREVRILCSARRSAGDYLRHEIIFDAEKFLGPVETEEVLKEPSLAENIRLIRDYAQKQKTGNELFDRRVAATCEGFRQAVDWLEKNIKE